jgi:hypothetical protein
MASRESIGLHKRLESLSLKRKLFEEVKILRKCERFKIEEIKIMREHEKSLKMRINNFLWENNYERVRT